MAAAHPSRRALALLAVTILSVGSGALALAVAPAAGPGAIGDGADATVVAERGSMVQVEPMPGPATHGGCLLGSVAPVAASIDPAQRWSIGVVSINWKTALYPLSGVRGPVVVVGDSLTHGSVNTTMRDLVDAGFGPVCIDAAVSRRVVVGTATLVSGVDTITRIKTSDPAWALPVVRWVLALGTNDVRPYPATLATFSTTIAYGRNAVGPTVVPMYWVDVRTRRGEPYTTYENEWNNRLAAAGTIVIGFAAWADALADPGSVFAGDLIHLTTASYPLRGHLVADAIIAT